jgi:hypothetical protein
MSDNSSLYDLKRALALVGAVPSRSDEFDTHAVYHCARADAWRAAFRWRELWHAEVDDHKFHHGDISERLSKEGIEGMRLIQETLS